MYASSKGSGVNVWMRRLVYEFAAFRCDNYQISCTGPIRLGIQGEKSASRKAGSKLQLYMWFTTRRVCRAFIISVILIKCKPFALRKYGIWEVSSSCADPGIFVRGGGGGPGQSDTNKL